MDDVVLRHVEVSTKGFGKAVTYTFLCHIRYGSYIGDYLMCSSSRQNLFSVVDTNFPVCRGIFFHASLTCKGYE